MRSVSDHRSRYPFHNAAATMVGLSNIMLRALTENHLLFHNIYISFFVLLEASGFVEASF